MPLQATSGAASYDAFGGGVAAVPNYIEDVFSTYLYTGNGSTQTITNGIDLAGKGGLVWIKDRSQGTGYHHILQDTARGASWCLFSNLTNGQSQDSAGTNFAFNTNGFFIGSSNVKINGSDNYASWTFRKQPKFFDVVTYTGNGTARTISHSLGSVPACIIVKQTSAAGEDWAVYHRGLPLVAGSLNDNFLTLNTTSAYSTSTDIWNRTVPTSTVFSVGNHPSTNSNGASYVAYLFAHDAGGFGLTGTDNVISCGSLNTGASGTSGRVNLGWEPQFVIIKRTNLAEGWMQFDNMRGLGVLYNANKFNPNTSGAEQGLGADECFIDSTGFTVGNVGNSQDFIYIAIRRGPMKVPTSGTSVYNAIARTGTGASATVTGVGFAPDLSIDTGTASWALDRIWIDKLRGAGPWLRSNANTAETANSQSITGWGNNGVTLGTGAGVDINDSGRTYINWYLRRAPSFFDEVCYTGGTGTPRVLNHNLATPPELVITKIRNFTGEDWVVHYNNGSSIIGGYLNNTTAFANSSTAPSTDITSLTSTTYTLNTSNRRVNGAYNYVAYLFATCAGVSKVGSYTGTGTTLQINCGFTGGARFVLIKRTDSTGDWYVWDSARGIVAGNDPYLLLNSTAAEVTSTDYIDTYSAGFEISSTAPAAINASGGTFIFLAIA